MSWRIHIARQSVNMSQEGLAKTLGVHRDTISSWETGKTEPSAAHLAALSHETGIPYAWLRFGYASVRLRRHDPGGVRMGPHGRSESE